MDEELLLMSEQRMWFLEMESTPGEDVVKAVEMTTQVLEYYINLVDKAVAGFQRIDSNSEKISTMGKMLSHSIVCPEKLFVKESQSLWQTALLSYFRKLPQLPQASATTTLVSQQYQHQGKTPTSIKIMTS